MYHFSFNLCYLTKDIAFVVFMLTANKSNEILNFTAEKFASVQPPKVELCYIPLTLFKKEKININIF